jgi:hypothetical protein
MNNFESTARYLAFLAGDCRPMPVPRTEDAYAGRTGQRTRQAGMAGEAGAS